LDQQAGELSVDTVLLDLSEEKLQLACLTVHQKVRELGMEFQKYELAFDSPFSL
jgi:hypothetical protein